MMKLDMISSKLLYTTTRIVGRRPGGTTSVGTAFFFHFSAGSETQVPVLITNKHVVSGTTLGEFLVHERSQDETPAPGAASFGISLQGFENLWVGHPGDIDLCAMPFEPLRQQALAQGKRVFYAPLGEGLLPSQTTLGSPGARSRTS